MNYKAKHFYAPECECVLESSHIFKPEMVVHNLTSIATVRRLR